jgi:hypothetical protein
LFSVRHSLARFLCLISARSIRFAGKRLFVCIQQFFYSFILLHFKIMKRILFSFLALTFTFSAPMLASSTLEGGEKHKAKDVGSPTAQPHMGEMPLVTEMEAPAATSESHITLTPKTEAVTEDATTESMDVIAPSTRKVKPMKLLREAKTNDGGSAFGILALVFGLLGFLLGWLFWPIGLIFAILAIVFGAVGMSGGRSGRGMAIAGLVFGILTIVLPVLIMALIIAAFL